MTAYRMDDIITLYRRLTIFSYIYCNVRLSKPKSQILGYFVWSGSCIGLQFCLINLLLAGV